MLQKESILTTIGVLEEPLGNARLHTTRLIAALLHANTPSVNQELCRLGTMDLLLVSNLDKRTRVTETSEELTCFMLRVYFK